ncbi:hypothetical protein GBAR_LOCUS3243 [Geodia barretti]|uniref:Uncharacterized protein n=2 Tax=Geodia barretti TaxID=519541 RepID=A0AA35W4D1_GEOBA|nr:hypothetical protein GBAR_LOCUS3243 [Geodia barretti]
MGGGDSGETGEVEEDLGKEEEAERERQLEAELMESTTTGPIGDIDVPLDEFTFEPHVGVSEGGDDETEI